MKDAAGFSARETRRYLLKRGFKPEFVVPFYYRPFDLRWIYWEPETKLLDRNRAEYFPHVFHGNLWLSAAQHNRKEFDPPLAASKLCSLHMIERGANLFPLFLKPEPSLLHDHETDGPHPNLSADARKYLDGMGAEPADLFHHLFAVLYAPSFAIENASGLSGDWPRIPLPATKQTFLASAALGREIVALLDPEGQLPKTAKSLKAVAAIHASEGNLNPDAGDLEVTAGWGHAGKGGVTMPGIGKITLREMTAAEQDGLPDGFAGPLGVQTADVWLNDRAYWSNVPVPVWQYTLGGYPVIKKWLSYRENNLFGRSLRVDEVRYVTEVARRIAAILLMGPSLGANYAAVKQATWDLAKSAKA